MRRPVDSLPQPDRAERASHRCLVRLRGLYASLKRAERKAADLLLAEPESIVGAGIVKFAARAGCSEATVVRLAQRLGCDGYSDLRSQLTHADAGMPYGDIGAGDEPETVLHKVFANSLQALQDTLAALDVAQYRRAVEALLAARAIAFFGLGNAAIVAREAFHKFFRIGVPCYTAEDVDLQLLILSSHLAAADVLAVVSHSGESRPMLVAARAARARGIRVLAITNFPRSTLARLADMVLLTAVFQEHVNGEIGSKRLAQLAVLESLYVNYLLRKGAAVRKRLTETNVVLNANKHRVPTSRRP